MFLKITKYTKCQTTIIIIVGLVLPTKDQAKEKWSRVKTVIFPTFQKKQNRKKLFKRPSWTTEKKWKVISCLTNHQLINCSRMGHLLLARLFVISNFARGLHYKVSNAHFISCDTLFYIIRLFPEILILNIKENFNKIKLVVRIIFAQKLPLVKNSTPLPIQFF